MNPIDSNPMAIEENGLLKHQNKINCTLPRRFEDLAVGHCVEVSVNCGAWRAAEVTKVTTEPYSMKKGFSPIECPGGYLVIAGVSGVVDRKTGNVQCSGTYRVRLIKNLFRRQLA